MKSLLLAAAAALSLGSAAHAEVVDASPAGFESRWILNLDAPQAKVRAAVLDIGKWWNGQHSYSGDAKNLAIDLKAGCFCETLKDGQVRHMSVVYTDATTLRLFGGLGPLQTTGATGHLILRFEPSPADKTLLTVIYDVGGYAKGGLAEVWAKPVDYVIGEQVTRLKKYVETGKPE